jgi:hypothetical protein
LAGGVYVTHVNQFSLPKKLFHTKSLLRAATQSTQEDRALPYLARSGFLPFHYQKTLIVQGDHRTGKSTFLGHTILNEWYPWWKRPMQPLRGFYLQGNQADEDPESWLRNQICAESKEKPFAAVLQLVNERAEQQWFCGVLSKHSVEAFLAS